MSHPKKKLFILLTDGIGLRNFVFSPFLDSVPDNWEVVFWHHVPYDFASEGLAEVPLPQPKLHLLTDSWKNVRKQVELNLNKARANDGVYDTYRFAPNLRTWRQKVKWATTQWLIRQNNADEKRPIIEAKLAAYERKTAYYKACIDQLKAHQPDLVLSTNQRPVIGIAPITAAKDLGIPTASMVFSWDNLPKATLVLDTDYYFVWSDHMKREMQTYYPAKKAEKTIVTGTPQFELHGHAKGIVSKETFYQQHGLNPDVTYLCYSGDDYTTSPDDPDYLRDVAKAIRKGNALGHRYGLLFRRCPVDFSARYDEVLAEYSDVIVPVNPIWEVQGSNWSAVLPTSADADLLRNTIAHTAMVINLGSSMVFDYALYDKPCAYIAFNSATQREANWSIEQIYNYVHFRSMPSKEAVVWLTDPDTIWEKLYEALREPAPFVAAAQAWFKVIHTQPYGATSSRIWQAIQSISNSSTESSTR